MLAVLKTFALLAAALVAVAVVNLVLGATAGLGLLGVLLAGACLQRTVPGPVRIVVGIFAGVCLLGVVARTAGTGAGLAAMAVLVVGFMLLATLGRLMVLVVRIATGRPRGPAWWQFVTVVGLTLLVAGLFGLGSVAANGPAEPTAEATMRVLVNGEPRFVSPALFRLGGASMLGGIALAAAGAVRLRRRRTAHWLLQAFDLWMDD